MIYKNHYIRPAPNFLVDLSLWSVRGYIMHEEPNTTVSREFDCGRGYQLKRDAEIDFVKYACGVIDNEGN